MFTVVTLFHVGRLPCPLYWQCFYWFRAQFAFGAEPRFLLDVIDDDISIGYGLAIGEVNGDAKPDILLADKTEIVWYENPGQRGAKWTRHVMARNLTARDNVCIAARDLDGDGLVEVAVGANWNPGNTSDTTVSGALFYLRRPDDLTKLWVSSVISDHDPTTHRMHWMKKDGKFVLVVLPLHGRDNKGGEGKPVRVTAYSPNDSFTTWTTAVLDESMHMTHNFDLVQSSGNTEALLVAGREGVKWIGNSDAKDELQESNLGAGEVRVVTPSSKNHYVTIEPMHGTNVVLYKEGNNDRNAVQRHVLDATLAQGHALGVGDLPWNRPYADCCRVAEP